MGEECREMMVLRWAMTGWKWKQVPRTSKEADLGIVVSGGGEIRLSM